VSFFTWVYRLPGRIDRSFGSTALATNAEEPGAGVDQLNVAAAGVLIQEIENRTGTGGPEGHDADPPA
jgi:hypothetical protein